AEDTMNTLRKTAKTGKTKLPRRPRNPLVALAHRRRAGAHGGSRKTDRQQGRRALRRALEEQ
ncbi:MAG: hypothetical protein ACK53M_02080, partial [Betaproteobacteria bacterium]